MDKMHPTEVLRLVEQVVNRDVLDLSKPAPERVKVGYAKELYSTSGRFVTAQQVGNALTELRKIRGIELQVTPNPDSEIVVPIQPKYPVKRKPRAKKEKKT